MRNSTKTGSKQNRQQPFCETNNVSRNCFQKVLIIIKCNELIINAQHLHIQKWVFHRRTFDRYFHRIIAKLHAPVKSSKNYNANVKHMRKLSYVTCVSNRAAFQLMRAPRVLCQNARPLQICNQLLARTNSFFWLHPAVTLPRPNIFSQVHWK